MGSRDLLTFRMANTGLNAAQASQRCRNVDCLMHRRPFRLFVALSPSTFLVRPGGRLFAAMGKGKGKGGYPWWEHIKPKDGGGR